MFAAGAKKAASTVLEEFGAGQQHANLSIIGRDLLHTIVLGHIQRHELARCKRYVGHHLLPSALDIDRWLGHGDDV
jgi:hypothetical protein